MNEKSQLIAKLIGNRETRDSYVRSKVSTNVASQLRAVRRRRNLTQADVASLSDMKQSRISAMESPGTQWNLDTLVRLVSAFRLGLIVKIVSYSDMLDWENSFSQDVYDPPSIETDAEFAQGECPIEAQNTVLISSPVAGGTWNGIELANPPASGAQNGYNHLHIANNFAVIAVGVVTGNADVKVWNAASLNIEQRVQESSLPVPFALPVRIERLPPMGQQSLAS